MFVANGKAGLLIADINGNEVNTLGQIQFDGSTNYVAAKNNTVFVANGSGGLKILEILPQVDDIIINKNSDVRADKGEAGYEKKNAAEVEIATPGKYEIFSTVWYDSGDEQKNESFYLELRDKNSALVSPQNPNARNYKVIPDSPGEPYTIARESGIFELHAGKYFIDVYHYAKIAAHYPQFVVGSISGPESVHLRGFRLVYEGE